MPTVGGTKFPYTKEGMAKAKAWSEMTGKPVVHPKLKSKPIKERKTKNWSGPDDLKMFKEGRITQDVTPKFREKKYQDGGYAEFNPGDATITQREATKQRMMSPEYMKMLSNLAMGTVGGGFKLTELGKLMMKGKKASKPILKQTKKTKPLSKEAKDRINAMREEYKIQEYMDNRLGRSSWDEYKQGGEIPQYGFGGWLKKATTPSKKAKKWWNKNVKGTAKKIAKPGTFVSKALTVPERYKGMSWKHLQKMKPMDFAALGLTMAAPLTGGATLPFASMAANKAQKIYGTKGLRGAINKPTSSPIDPNLGFAKQRFGSGSNITDLLSSLAGGSMEMGGEVPAGRRMYGMGGNTKKKRKK